ncbi:MAG TPA: DUF3662 and FHA domain-containing protein [Chloroflexota bacterium]|jgi:hypothetical protein
MTALLGRIERLLERAFEAPSQRLFHTRLQPLELARAIARVMVAESAIGPDGVRVPNHYLVTLHPDDYQRFAGQREALERDLQTYVLRQTQQRGWQCSGWPAVELREAVEAPRGRPQVSADMITASSPADSTGGATDLLDRTSVLPPVAPPPAARPPVRRRWLELEGGSRRELHAPVLRIGRALDNDLVLDHESVSRHHAELRGDRDLVTIVDLDSTNGTRVNGESVQAAVLSAGDTLHVGAVPLRYLAAG